MFTQEQIREIQDRALALSDADQTEVAISDADLRVTRFAEGFIHQNTHQRLHDLSVRTIYGGRTGRASINRLGEGAIGSVLANATCPFGGSGLPKRESVLIEKGVAMDPAAYGGAGNMILEGGDASLDEMVRSTERGLLVTDLWSGAGAASDPRRAVAGYAMSEGTGWIEKGRVVHGVEEFRFRESVAEMLNRVEMLSPLDRGGPRCPAMKIGDFNCRTVV